MEATSNDSSLIRILQVEDSADDAELAVRELEKAGLKVAAERVDSAEAFRTALIEKKWDALIVDFALPRFSAPAALEIFREQKFDMPFILVTGTIGEEKAVSMILAGASDCVMKQNLARLPLVLKRELEQTALKREQRRAEAALIENEKMKAMTKFKDEFMFKTIHDLRSPSTIIRMVIDSCRNNDLVKNDKGMAKNIDYIRKANEHLIKLINDLLKIGQETNPQFTLECKPLPLHGVLELVLTELAPMASAKHVGVEHGDLENLPDARGNEDAIKEVFTNLVENAIKYNPENGRVTIEYEVSGQSVRISVQDTGKGIPAEYLGKLFSPYYRADVGKEIEGTGLGLYIVKCLVEKMGGSVAVSSSVGQGSRFTVSLPLA